MPSITQPDTAGLTARERLLALWLIQGLRHTLAAQLGEGDKVPKGSQRGETYFKWLESPSNGLGLKALRMLAAINNSSAVTRHLPRAPQLRPSLYGEMQ